MARPLRRDVLAWISSIPSCITFLVCLGLPQVRDCHGRVQTASDNGTSPLLVVMALLALAPLAWRWPPLRRLVMIMAIVAGVLAVASSLLVVPIGLYCIFARPWRSTEQFVAFSCSCVAIVFVIVFPVIGLFSTWLEGATLAWATAWVVMSASLSWASAAKARSRIVPDVVEASVTAAPPALSQAALPEAIGDYDILGELGAGGMARVYRGRHRHLETEHAIKVLDPSYREVPEARQRFLDEAKIQAKLLTHPNIVKVTNIVATPEHAALVMELIDGPCLDDVIESLPGNPDEIRRIMLGILSAVGHAHRCGVIHRDLKPSNVLLDGAARIPCVTDFGIAKVTTGGYVPSSSTGGGARMGTLPYMSPEQIKGARDVTVRSDVFALGVVLYEMTTGGLPFRGDCDYELMDAIVCGRYFLPRVIDPRIARVIRRALQPDPSRRYASCDEMAADLRALRVVVAR